MITGLELVGFGLLDLVLELKQLYCQIWQTL